MAALFTSFAYPNKPSEASNTRAVEKLRHCRQTMNKLLRNICQLSQIQYRFIATRSLKTCNSTPVLSKNRLICTFRRRSALRTPVISIPSRKTLLEFPQPNLCKAGSKSPSRNMSSDADYAAFLDKANQDTGSVGQQSTSKKSYGTKSVDTTVPKGLEKVDAYYTSDTDEPFEPVSLKFDGGSDLSTGK